MAYTLHTQFDSPNTSNYRRALPIRRVILHWWGNPTGQDPYGVINWLCNPASQVSAHAVIWPANVAVLVNYDRESWANGDQAVNRSTLTIECDPNHVEETIPTIVAYLADLVRQGVLAPDFTLDGHRDVVTTACPGAYYPRLAEIRQAVDTPPTSNTPEEEPIMYVISCPGRGIALVGPGHFAPCTDDTDVVVAIRLSGGRVLETNDPAEWDRWRRLMIGESANAALRDSDVQRMVDAVKGISASEVASKLKVVPA